MHLERVFGNSTSGSCSYAAWSTPYGHGETTPMVPRSRWAALIAGLPSGPEHPFLPPVHDQHDVGQCNPEAAAAAAEYCRAVQGLPYVQLSAADLYHRINFGVDQGSHLEDALVEMALHGIGTARTCGLLWGRRGFRPASAPERARFRVLEYWLCPTFDHVMSAVLSGFAVVSGVRWWQEYEPEAEGWMSPRGRGRSGGHALFGYKPATREGHFGLWHQNSFGAGWGNFGGRCVLPESAFAGGAIGGWWALRQVVTETVGVVADAAA